MLAVEVKRRGEIDGVEQLARYVELLDKDARLRPVRGIFAAQTSQPAGQGAGRRTRPGLGRGRLRRAEETAASTTRCSKRQAARTRCRGTS